MSHGGYLSHNEVSMIERSRRKVESGKVTNPVELLRYMCLSRGYSGLLHFGRVFREMSHKGKKVINLKEFIAALDKLGLELTEHQAVEVFKHFEKDEFQTTILIDDLLEGVKPYMSPSRKSIVHQAFAKIDKEESGSITLEALRHAYDVTSNPKYEAGIETREQILKNFIDHFEEHHHKNRPITLEDFENYYAALSASVDDDTYFDLVIRQVYKL